MNNQTHRYNLYGIRRPMDGRIRSRQSGGMGYTRPAQNQQNPAERPASSGQNGFYQVQNNPQRIQNGQHQQKRMNVGNGRSGQNRGSMPNSQNGQNGSQQKKGLLGSLFNLRDPMGSLNKIASILKLFG